MAERGLLGRGPMTVRCMSAFAQENETYRGGISVVAAAFANSPATSLPGVSLCQETQVNVVGPLLLSRPEVPSLGQLARVRTC